MDDEKDKGIESRIKKDIAMFDKSIQEFSYNGNDKEVIDIIELSKMYASDSESYLKKGDFYTSFSCISYAHGLLDSIKKLYGDNDV
ncbi:DUF357 domain-containing protein [Candidatus Marsarchaeota archaeon]|jgi:hypothetical protein|nr:DUF357 domain-containing protein [Candidatus Marsarchaeota archaeon]MCL5090357.1 DUF357 domain-containing protein [Candidatus Marsarchaeota archaeon]